MKGKVSKGSAKKIPHKQSVTFLDHDQTDWSKHHTNKTTLSRFVVKRNLARSKQSKYSKTKEVKVQRKLRRNNRKQIQDKRELLEGTCYQSGIGTSSTHVSLIQFILEDREY